MTAMPANPATRRRPSISDRVAFSFTQGFSFFADKGVE